MAIILDDYELEAVIGGKMLISDKQRKDIIEDALSFEGCNFKRSDLEKMPDTILVKEYRNMLYDYAMGQI